MAMLNNQMVTNMSMTVDDIGQTLGHLFFKHNALGHSTGARAARHLAGKSRPRDFCRNRLTKKMLG